MDDFYGLIDLINYTFKDLVKNPFEAIPELEKTGFGGLYKMVVKFYEKPSALKKSLIGGVEVYGKDMEKVWKDTHKQTLRFFMEYYGRVKVQ